MTMPMHPDTPLQVGDIVQMADHYETRENMSYAHLIGEVGVIIEPRAGSHVEREDALIEVEFDNGEREVIFHWRCFLIRRRIAWEV